MDRNKLGFYIQISQGVHDRITAIKPPVILVHAWDQGLLEEIRRFRAPEAFVIGRMDYVRFGGQQVPVNDLVQGWLTGGDPEANGRFFAEHILEDNFRLAQRAEGGRRLVDAWMSLNECVPGPGSNAYRNGKPAERAEIEGKLRAYDRFQFGFRNKLMEHGIEAVAFNFGAGNFGTAEHYADFFPLTLGTYTYLGFHEYGWPALSKSLNEEAESSAGTYSPIVRTLRERMGRDYRVIITETGLARMYKHPEDPPGDVGWLYPGDTISQDDYWRSLAWYNQQINQDDFVLGACLFQVGHEGKWVTFRHIGEDNAGRPIEILNRIEGLAAASRAAEMQAAAMRAAVARMGDQVGLDANRPLEDSGELAGQVADPRLIASSGVGWVRLNFVLDPWKSQRDPERHAGRTWEEAYRQLVNGFRREGLKIYGLISNEAVKMDNQNIQHIFREPPPAGAASHPWIDRYVDTFVDILGMYGSSLSAVESFNEPDDWKGQQRNLVHPGWFAIMLQRIYQEVRRHSEFDHIPLITGPVEGMGGNGNAGALDYLPRVYSYGKTHLGWGQPGKPFPFDGVGYHLYVEEDLNRPWPDHQKSIRATYKRYLDQMRQTIRGNGDNPNKPLYISELGWHTNKGPEDRQAACLPFALETLVTGPWNVALAVVFCTQDWGNEDTLKWYGLYRQGSLSEASRKPAHNALNAFCQRSRNGGGSGPGPSLPAGVTNQQVINAFDAVIRAFGLTGWDLMERNGISLAELINDRKGPYRGPALATLPNLSAEQRSMLLAQLGMDAVATRGVGGGFLINMADLTGCSEVLPDAFAISPAAAGGPLERRVARTWTRWNGLLGAVAAELDLDVALATAVLALSARHPTSDRHGRLHIRFDVQIFLARSQAGQEVPAGHFWVDPGRPWQQQTWRPEPATAWRKVHAGQDEEWAALRQALQLDAEAAWQATAMGMTGVMGFNHALLGYASAQQMQLSLACSERMQVLGLFDLIATPARNSAALIALRRGDLDTFAVLHAGLEGAGRYASELAAAVAFLRRANPLD
jgi:hypothetical protein